MIAWSRTLTFQLTQDAQSSQAFTTREDANDDSDDYFEDAEEGSFDFNDIDDSIFIPRSATQYRA